MDSRMLEILERHEGFRPYAYYCPTGFLSIGYGYNLQSNTLNLPATEVSYYSSSLTTQTPVMSQSKASELLMGVVQRVEQQLAGNLGFWYALDEVRQGVLTNMAYNLGTNGLLKFRKTLGFVAQGDYQSASVEMLNSPWANQVHGRAQELSRIMATGSYY
jgi:lysozyme